MEKKITITREGEDVSVQVERHCEVEDTFYMLGALCMTLEIRHKDDGAAIDHLAEVLEICAKNMRDRKMPKNE